MNSRLKWNLGSELAKWMRDVAPISLEDLVVSTSPSSLFNKLCSVQYFTVNATEYSQ